MTRRVHRLGGISIIPAALFVARRRAALDGPGRGGRAADRVVCTLFLALRGSSRFRGRAAVLCLFDKATRPRDRPRRTALTVMLLAPRATPTRRGQVRSCTRVLRAWGTRRYTLAGQGTRPDMYTRTGHILYGAATGTTALGGAEGGARRSRPRSSATRDASCPGYRDADARRRRMPSSIVVDRGYVRCVRA